MVIGLDLVNKVCAGASIANQSVYNRPILQIFYGFRGLADAGHVSWYILMLKPVSRHM